MFLLVSGRRCHGRPASICGVSGVSDFVIYSFSVHRLVLVGEKMGIFFYSLRLVFYWHIFLRFLMANVHLNCRWQCW